MRCFSVDRYKLDEINLTFHLSVINRGIISHVKLATQINVFDT